MAKERADQGSQQGSAGPRGGGPAGRFGTRIERAKDVRGAMERLLEYLKPFKWALIAVFALVIISTLMGLAGPILMGLAIDRYILTQDLAGLGRITLLMLGAYLLSWGAMVGQGLLMATAAQEAMRNLRRDLLEHIQTLSLSFFDRHPHGELMSRLTNDMDAINRVLTQNVVSLFSGLLSLVGIVIAMFALNLWLALGTMLVLPFMLFFTGYIAKRTRSGFRGLQMKIGQLNGKLEEMFSGQKVVIAFSQQDSVLADFERANCEVRDEGIKAKTYSLLIPPMMGVFSNANTAVVAGLGGWMTLQGLATVGTIATFITYSRRFAQPLRQLGDLYNQIQSALAGAERIFEIIDTEPELSDAPDAIELTHIEGDVRFDHVDFSYVPGVPVIKDMTFHAEPGQTIALVGPTGAGKTTMVNLLSRFYDIQSGQITIDGVDIRRFKKATLRKKLGVVLQDTFLFSGTVLDNIRYGRLDATDDECIEAAKLANADVFIRHLPESYHTVLSERGSNLSQGQRQLLTIARAILADPSILVLDEATSSVDTRTEIHIQEALLRLMKGRTSFVIAHRLSTIRNADKLLIINDGEIIERGTHDELLAKEGFYYNLYNSQFKGQVALPQVA